MSEYIEREKVGLTDFEIAMCNGDYKEGLKILLDKIESIPAADVRPVVLCRDCKHNAGKRIWLNHEETADCTNGHGYPPLDWFCADGAKRGES